MSDYTTGSHVLNEKRIYVTGANGFLGRHICSRLEHLGAQVIKNQLNLKMAIPPMGPAPDLVIHLAADVRGIAPNQRNPYSFLLDNTMITIGVMEIMRQWTHTPIVAAGSVCAYPANAALPFSENDFWNGKPEHSNLGYGLAKRHLAGALECAALEWGLRYAHLICANLYGPGDYFNSLSGHIIPSVIRRMAETIDNDEHVFWAWGTGEATRDFLYVEDAADAYVEAATLMVSGSPSIECNIGSHREISIKDTIDIIAQALGYRGIISFDSTKPRGQSRRLVDNSKALLLLNWRPHTSIRSGIEYTVNWYMNERNHV